MNSLLLGSAIFTVFLVIILVIIFIISNWKIFNKAGEIVLLLIYF